MVVIVSALGGYESVLGLRELERGAVSNMLHANGN